MITKKDFMLCGSLEEEQLDNFLKKGGNFKANIKFDGERIIAFVGNEIFLVNRRGRIKNSQYPEVVEELKLFEKGVYDGEVISFDDKFEKLQRRALTKNPNKIKELQKEIPVKYMIFDVIKLNGLDLRYKKLSSRILYLHYPRLDRLKHIEITKYEDIITCYERCKKENREGIIIKDMDSRYQHRRSDCWLKLKFFSEAVIRVIDYTDNNKGIRAEDKELNAVQISKDFNKVKGEIEDKGYCDVRVRYLEKTKNNRYRFISFKGIKNG